MPSSTQNQDETRLSSRVKMKVPTTEESDCDGGFGDACDAPWSHFDETDALPKNLRFNFFDFLCIIISIGTYVADLGMDIFVAYVYYSRGFIGYFVLTLVFVIIPAGTMTAFSLRWYVMDMDNPAIPKPSCGKWIIRTVFLLLQCSPVLRYVDSLNYGLKSQKAAKKGDESSQVKYYTYMMNEDADASLLRLFEGFMESAPQVTLQLYILIYHFRDPDGPFADRSYYFQLIAVLSSLISLAWSLAAYNRSLRFPQPDKLNITYKATVVQFFWHLCGISARVFALAVFAATYPILIIPVCIAHWLSMLAWLIVQGNQACSTECEEALFNLVVAFIYVFTFFNIREEPTRYKYAIFYVVSLLENTVLLFTWFFSDEDESAPEIIWFRTAGLVGDYALFFVAILCMVLYYVYFHPTIGALCTIKDPSAKHVKKENYTKYQPPSHQFAMESTKNNKLPLSRRSSIDQCQVGSSSTTAGGVSSKKNVTFTLDGGDGPNSEMRCD